MTPATGTMYAVPVDVMRPLTWDAVGLNVTTAQSGGSITVNMGLYRDDGSGSAPALDGGHVIRSTGQVLTTAGARTYTFATNQTLDPGRYWTALLLVQSSTPTTSPVVSSINGGPCLGSSAPATVARGLQIGSGLSTWPSSSSAITPIAAPPVLSLRRAA